MHLVLTGATGLVGSGILHSMLQNPSVQKISILSRRPVAQAEGQAKAHVIIHKDFTTYDAALLGQLKDVDGVVWAQGISATEIGKEEYVQITNAYPLAFARAISQTTNPKPVNFIYVSGEGATTTPGILTPHWARWKGITEAALITLSKDPAFSNLRPISLRPGGVDPGKHEEIAPYVPTKGKLFDVVKSFALPVFRTVASGMLSPTRELGDVLTELAMGKGEALKEGDVGVIKGGEGRILNNAWFRKKAEL